MPQLTLFVHRTQELKNRLAYDKEEDSMTHQIMTFWFKCRTKLIHDYSLVGYILSPNPWIMNGAREKMLQSPIYSDAVKHLIRKLAHKIGKSDLQMQSTAVLALQEAAEYFVIDVFSDTNLCVMHGKHVTIKVKDMVLACRIGGIPMGRA
jgi:histone H3/H4